MFDWKSLPRPIVALSPMADMTDSPFCQTVKTLASPVMFREMVSSEAVVRGNEKTLLMADFVEAERPIIQQIFGADPSTMAEAARNIEAAYHPDGIDINMGCPVYKITSNFNGAALMKEPCLAASIISAMKAAITVPLSVKIRLGWSDPKECLDFVRVVEDAGADLITIHGRTKAQAYTGYSDWDMIKEARSRVSIPVLANGDIFTPEDVLTALSVTGCDGVLVARGGLGNPWLFSRAEVLLATGVLPPEPTLEERLRVLLEHAKRHVDHYGERGIVTFRKHLSWYLKGIPGVKTFRQALHTVDSLEALEAQLSHLREILPENEPLETPIPAFHPYKTRCAGGPTQNKKNPV